MSRAPSKPLRRIGGAALTALAYLVVFVYLIPTLWIPLTSVRPEIEIAASPPIWIPREVSLENYAHVFGLSAGSQAAATRVTVPSYFLNSVVVSAVTVLIATFVGALAGYAFSRFEFRGRQPLFLLTLFVRALPALAMGIPLFILYRTLDLTDTKPGLILIYSALSIPFATWLMEGFFSDIPKEIEEAAEIDGCSKLQRFLHVALPLARPGLAATLVFIFLHAWNEFGLALVLTSTPAAKTLPIGLYEFVGEFRVAWGPLTAVGTILLLPGLLVTYWAQRHFVRGLTFGAIKS